MEEAEVALRRKVAQVGVRGFVPSGVKWAHHEIAIRVLGAFARGEIPITHPEGKEVPPAKSLFGKHPRVEAVYTLMEYDAGLWHKTMAELGKILRHGTSESQPLGSERGEDLRVKAAVVRAA